LENDPSAWFFFNFPKKTEVFPAGGLAVGTGAFFNRKYYYRKYFIRKFFLFFYLGDDGKQCLTLPQLLTG
jgi:hypothetical protein